MKKIIVIASLASLMTGCALTKNGFEVGAKVGMYGVDEKQESQQMHRKPMPLICYVWPTPDKCSGFDTNGGSQS
jgi:hypothetical protein